MTPRCKNCPCVSAWTAPGLSPDDGPTHHGLFDIAMIRSIPNIVFMQPKDEAEFVHMLRTMNHYQNGPTVIQLPRDAEPEPLSPPRRKSSPSARRKYFRRDGM